MEASTIKESEKEAAPVLEMLNHFFNIKMLNQIIS